MTTNLDLQVNEWGDQCTNEFFRAMIESGGFYSLEKPGDFTTLVDLSVYPLIWMIDVWIAIL